jgi:hypothetical protein
MIGAMARIARAARHAANYGTRVTSRAKNPLFAKGKTLTIEELKYALKSWQRTLAFARFPNS